MMLKARVKAGRLVVDEPTDLPEGTEVEETGSTTKRAPPCIVHWPILTLTSRPDV